VTTRLAVLLAGLVANYLIALTVAFCVPGRLKVAAQALDPGARPILRSFLLGFLASGFFLGTAFLSALSNYAFPAAFILAGLYFLIGLLGMVAISYQVGRALLIKAGWFAGRPLTAIGVGTLLLHGVFRVPYLGLVAFVLFWATGVGLVLTTRLGGGKAWNLRPLME
jgi:hypothetical protein